MRRQLEAVGIGLVCEDTKTTEVNVSDRLAAPLQLIEQCVLFTPKKHLLPPESSNNIRAAYTEDTRQLGNDKRHCSRKSGACVRFRNPGHWPTYE
jgi:hypothetical protein